MFKTNTPNSERSLENDFDDAIEKGRNTSNASNAPENEFDKVIGNLKSGVKSKIREDNVLKF